MPFSLPALPSKVVSAALLDGTPVEFGQSGLAFTVVLPPAKMDPVISVVKLTVEDNPRTFWSPGRDEEVADSLYGKTFAAIPPDRPLWLCESWLQVTLPKPVTAQKFRLSLKAENRTAIREWQMF